MHLPIKAWLLFEDKPHWYLQWMRPGFRHVAIVILFDNDELLAVNHSWGHTEIGILPYDTIWEDLRNNAHVIQLCHIKNSRIVRAPTFTCTQMCKSLLGVDKWWVQTPYQLYKYGQSFGKEVHCERRC